MSKNKLPYTPTKEEIIRLFEVCPIPKLMIGLFVSLMCGLRIQEIRRLKINDINLQKREIIIRNSKNPNRSKEGYGKDRIVPLPLCSISPIKRWLNVIEGKSIWFLPSSKCWDIPVSKEWLEEGFSYLRKTSGLNKVEYDIKYKKNSKNKIEGRRQYLIKFHSLRHFYATYVYERTDNIEVVSKLLGHNQISTTQIYAQTSDKKKKSSVDFAFNNIPTTKIFQNNHVSGVNNTILETYRPDKKPLEILEERFAKGEISISDFQTSLRLLKIKQEYFNNDNNEKKLNDPEREIKHN